MVPLVLLTLALADAPFEPPVVGRPESYRGAVGVFRLQVEAETKNAVEGKPLRYTIRITADSNVPVHAPPSRPEVENDPEFKKRFYFEKPELTAKKDDKKQVWEFYYLLIPKSVAVKEIPDMPFCYFNPQFGDDSRGYQEAFTKSFPLSVAKKKEVVPPVEEKVIPDYPTSFRWHADEDALLKRHRPFSLPSTGWLLALLGIPPLAALGWLFLWRHFYPDAARLAKRRRSWAAREALKTLHTVHGEQGGSLAERIAEIVTGYLSQRYDLSTAVPTPTEVDVFLRGARLPDLLREQATTLLQTCDALRFSPMPPAVSGSLLEAAEKLILDLEAHSWSLLS